MPLTIRIHRAIEGIYFVIVRPPGSESYAQPVFLAEDMINLEIHLVSAACVGDRADPVVVAAVIGATHVQIGHRKLLHHPPRHRVDEVPRRGGGRARGSLYFWTSRALVSCQAVEADEHGKHRSAPAWGAKS